MSDSVQFGDEQELATPTTMSSNKPNFYMSRQVLGEPVKPSFLKLVKNLKLARTDKQAYYILISFGIICLLLSLFIIGYYVLGIGRDTTKHISAPKSVRELLPPDMVRKINEQNRR